MKTNIHGNIAYPLVQLKDKKLEKKINDQIAYSVIGETVSTEKVLLEKLREMAEYTYDLEHGVTFNKDALLSFNVYYEACGAYCSSSTYYFNFDLKTGNSLSVKDLTKEEKATLFTRMLDSTVRASLIRYQQTELDSLKESDSSTYDLVYGSFENCLNQINIKGFAIYSDRMDFINDCDYPHVIRAFTPNTNFVFKIADLSAYLKPEYRIDLKQPRKDQKAIRNKKR